MAPEKRAKSAPASAVAGKKADDIEQDVFARQEDIFTVSSPKQP